MTWAVSSTVELALYKGPIEVRFLYGLPTLRERTVSMKVRWLVVAKRDTEPVEVTPFEEYHDAFASRRSLGRRSRPLDGS